MRHKIAVICTHYNHIDIAPFVLDYWKRFVTHAYIFDNGSNDGSLENFAKYDWITVNDMTDKTGGKLNDTVNMNIKNSFWKTVKDDYDYIMICDFDECLWCEDLDRVLDKFDNEEIGMIYPKYCNMISEEYHQYNPNKLYHELNPYCHNKFNESNLTTNTKEMDIKMYLINPKIVEETGYSPGQHSNRTRAKNNKSIRVSNIYVFHLHYIGRDYAKQVHEKNKSTMSQENINHGYGVQYRNEKDITSDYAYRLKNKIEYYNYTYNGFVEV